MDSVATPASATATATPRCNCECGTNDPNVHYKPANLQSGAYFIINEGCNNSAFMNSENEGQAVMASSRQYIDKYQWEFVLQDNGHYRIVNVQSKMFAAVKPGEPKGAVVQASRGPYEWHVSVKDDKYRISPVFNGPSYNWNLGTVYTGESVDLQSIDASQADWSIERVRVGKSLTAPADPEED